MLIRYFKTKLQKKESQKLYMVSHIGKKQDGIWKGHQLSKQPFQCKLMKQYHNKLVTNKFSVCLYVNYMYSYTNTACFAQEAEYWLVIQGFDPLTGCKVLSDNLEHCV